MSILRQSIVATISAVTLLCASGGPALAQQAPLAGLKTQKTMFFVFDNAPVGEVLAAMSQQFGFVVMNQNLPEARITVRSRKEHNAADAIMLFNEILVPLGYVALVTAVSPDPARGTAGNIILRVVTLHGGRIANIPVFKGADPNEIPLNDDLRTQVIPLKHIAAIEVVDGLRPLNGERGNLTASPDSNTIIITETSAYIHRLVQIIQGLDKPQKPKEERQGTMRRSEAVSPLRAC